MGVSYDPKAAAAARTGVAEVPPVSRVLLAELVVSNLVSIAWAVHEQWPLLMLLWSYWIQSVVIGWFYRKRILALQRFSTDGFTSNDKPVLETPEARRETANFLTMHYGFFHLIYAVFLTAFGFSGSLGDTTGLGREDVLAVLALGAVFAFTQYAEHRRNVALDRGRRPNIGAMMFLPYLRVVPMHVIIIGGAMLHGGGAALIVFGALKTLADVGMLILEQRLVARSVA
jgi:hypothetical protein